MLTTPMTRILKKFLPDSEIDLLIKEQYSDVYRFNPYIRNIILYDKNKSDTIISDLADRDYDIVIDLQNNFRSRKMRRRLKKLFFFYDKPGVKKMLLVHLKINLLKNSLPVAERYIDSFPGLEPDGEGCEVFLPEGEEKQEERPGENIIGFCPGSRHFTKMWPEEYFIELGEKIADEGYKIKLLGGKDDKAICERLAEKIPGAENLSNNNELLKTIKEMKSCRAVICNDSGLMHAASAAGVPLIAIFGSTVREFGFLPYKVKNLILENNSLSCRPCSHIGRKKCPKGHFECMRSVTPEIAFTNFEKFVSSL